MVDDDVTIHMCAHQCVYMCLTWVTLLPRRAPMDAMSFSKGCTCIAKKTKSEEGAKRAGVQANIDYEDANIEDRLS